MKAIGRLHVGLYRATGGLVGGRTDGLDVLLLETRGRRSGLLRTNPLPYFREAGSYVVVASFGGADRDPDWLHNLRAQPQARLQVGRERLSARARVAAGEERARLWDHITSLQPRYAGYQEKTAREIPLVVLEPGSTEPGSTHPGSTR